MTLSDKTGILSGGVVVGVSGGGFEVTREWFDRSAKTERQSVFTF
jgi:hypothetical protein